eukprot:scaffold238056_cov13-Tisochrysis_lutea.AAC.1
MATQALSTLVKGAVFKGKAEQDGSQAQMQTQLQSFVVFLVAAAVGLCWLIKNAAQKSALQEAPCLQRHAYSPDMNDLQAALTRPGRKTPPSSCPRAPLL